MTNLTLLQTETTTGNRHRIIDLAISVGLTQYHIEKYFLKVFRAMNLTINYSNNLAFHGVLRNICP